MSQLGTTDVLDVEPMFVSLQGGTYQINLSGLSNEPTIKVTPDGTDWIKTSRTEDNLIVEILPALMRQES